MKKKQIKYEIRDFALIHNFNFQPSIRDIESKLPLITIKFDGVETAQGHILSGDYGHGNTVDTAIKNYCKKISGKMLILGGFSKWRTEIECPQLIHTKLFKK